MSVPTDIDAFSYFSYFHYYKETVLYWGFTSISIYFEIYITNFSIVVESAGETNDDLE